MFCRSNYGILFSLDLSFIFMQNTIQYLQRKFVFCLRYAKVCVLSNNSQRGRRIFFLCHKLSFMRRSVLFEKVLVLSCFFCVSMSQRADDRQTFENSARIDCLFFLCILLKLFQAFSNFRAQYRLPRLMECLWQRFVCDRFSVQEHFLLFR